MKIVITGRNFADGDKAVELLRSTGHEVLNYGHLDYTGGTSEAEVFALVKDADIAVVGAEPYHAAMLERCPNLKLISRRGIGYDSIDVEACRRLGIAVCRTTGMVEGSVAEHVMACILYFARRVDLASADMHNGIWKRVKTGGAKSHTLGLVGFGGIGKEIAKRAVPFGMEVLYYCRHPKPEWEAEYGVKYAPLDELLAQSDYVSANMPLTESTLRLCGAEFFAKMKQGSVYINISRGPVMDPLALKAALDNGHLHGAAVDVYDVEPCTDSPLRDCPNALLTPHIAPFTAENIAGMNDLAAQNVLDWLEGKLEEKYRVV